MTLDPIASAGPATQIHLAAVLPAFAIGTWMMLRPKGTAPHKALGRVYLLLMIAAAASAFFIQGINPGGFSLLHLLSLFVLAMAPLAWWRARRGDIAFHRWAMIGMYVGALWIAGLLTLLPGRVLHRALLTS